MAHHLVLLTLLAFPLGCSSVPWYQRHGMATEQETRKAAAVPKLVQALRSGDPDSVTGAGQALRSIGAPAVPALVDELRSGSQAAAWALGEIGPPAASAVPALAGMLGHDDDHMRKAAVIALRRIGPSAAEVVPALVRVLEGDGEDDVRREVPPALVAIGRPTPQVMRALARASERDRGRRVRRASRRARQALSLALAREPRRTPTIVRSAHPPGRTAIVAASRPSPSARPVVVAVFDIEGRAAGLSHEVVDRLTDHLATELTATGRFKVIPRSQVRRRLVQEKTKSYRDCVDQQCQIELGRELAAQKSLASRVDRVEGRCVVSGMLYDLRSETSERAGSVDTGCGQGQLLGGLRRLAVKLARQ